ncbi:MAG: hypothetical protein QGH34_00635 [Candidatus Woesearchaeota archaeon]|jgi:hypothetical protein|nr:hypothetical protein [Candidatus Woesearchaeota archaeon]|tara:strand:- start:1146 stop:1535 length:390 start_codon:yes stop_codon:yes gene_type:complete
MKKIFLLFFFVVGIFVGSCAPQQEDLPTGPSEFDSFAKCLNQNGLKMYGQYTCGACKKQRALFGPSFQYVGEIECHPRGENPQTQLCLEKDIEKTPTWTFEKDGLITERLEGFQSLETLSEISGCALPP